MTQPTLRTTGLARLLSFIRLGRPLHLAGGFVFHGLGVTVALYGGAAFEWRLALVCQAVITATQWMTHYSNEYFDRDADAAAVTPTRWSSGSRVLPAGILPAWVALAAAIGLAGLALAFAALLLRLAPAPGGLALLLLAAIGLAWNYSSPPLWLNRRGLGEATAAVLVPGLTTLLGFQVQTGRLALLPVLAAAPLCCLQFAMLLSLNFADAAGDAQVNKRTLVVIFGRRAGTRLFLGALLLAYLSLPPLVWLGLPLPAALGVLVTLPLAVAQAWRIGRGAAAAPECWDALAFWSLALLMAAALAEVVVFVWLRFGGEIW